MTFHTDKSFSVAVVGGGPAGLMAAEVLIQNGVNVEVFDAMPSVGRKFLMAGKGGMNISHSEPGSRFCERYGQRSEKIAPLLLQFGQEALIDWAHQLGIETFVGSSGRVFPADMKAAPLLREWLQRLRSAGVVFHVRHRWLGWKEAGQLYFQTLTGEKTVSAHAVVFALGGGSWAKLGSDGAWVDPFRQQGVEVALLKPSNCGFNVAWSDYFSRRHAGDPVKPVCLSFTDVAGQQHRQQGEFNITADGVEGGLIYALSSPIREVIAQSKSAEIYLDLVPEISVQHLVDKLAQPRGKNSLANHLRKKIGIKGVKVGLLHEILNKDDYAHPNRLAEKIKALPIQLLSPRPLDEAISSAGGVLFEALDERLMIKKMPGVFCAGEMLDWEAPTGGYLLTACWSTGYAAGQGVLQWLQKKSDNG